MGYVEYNFVGDGKVKLTGGKTYKLVLEGRAEFDVEVGGWILAQDRDFIGVSDMADKCLMMMPAGKSFAARVICGNTTYPITFNPSGYIEGEDDSYYFCFPDGTPSGFATDIIVELLGYRPDMVETAWYTDNTDDPSSLIGLGDRRLRLPSSTNGYVETPNTFEVQRVEMTIKADNIYPKCYLRVTDVRTEQRTEKIVYADDTEYSWPWTAYTVKAELIDGSEFPFRKTYVKDGEKLRALFLSDYDEQEAYSAMGLDWGEDNTHETVSGGTQAVEIDITPTQWGASSVVDGWMQKRYWNASGTLTSSSTATLYATQIDVEAYRNCTVYIYVYVGPSTASARCMFKDANNEVISGTVERIRQSNGTPAERTIPSNAKYLCLTNRTENIAAPYVKVMYGATTVGFLLAGMEFDVGFSPYGNEYTLIRNEDYGAKLPSSMLYPNVGDVFVLTGWTVDSMNALGLVSTAEAQLLEFTQNYLNALQDDGWIFRCNMMTGNEPLLEEGTKVKVYHESLPIGYKQSRIIGYELRLDYPEDSPVYEVGETDAYSRIKQLEKQVEKI